MTEGQRREERRKLTVMSKKVFSREEIASLAANPYTHRVSDRQISFTKEFKEKFWQEYNAGKTPAEIVKEYGYEVDVLGMRRIEGIRGHIRKEYLKAEKLGFGTADAGVCVSNHEDVKDVRPEEPDMKRMQRELQYMRKELEFLKKIISIRNTKK